MVFIHSKYIYLQCLLFLFLPVPPSLLIATFHFRSPVPSCCPTLYLLFCKKINPFILRNIRGLYPQWSREGIGKFGGLFASESYLNSGLPFNIFIPFGGSLGVSRIGQLPRGLPYHREQKDARTSTPANKEE